MKVNHLKFGVYLSYASLFLTNITNLVLTPFIIRNLGQSEYGVYVLIGSFVGYIAVLDFGLGNATTRFVAKYRAENDKTGQENFLSLTSIIYIAISLLILIVGTFLYFLLDNIFGDSLTINEIKIAKILFIILVINLAFTLPMKSFTGIVNAYEKFIIPRTIVIVRIAIRTILIFTFLSLGYKAIAIVLIDTILNFISMFITMAYVFIRLRVRIRLHDFKGSLLKEIFNYSSLIFISIVVDQLYWRIGHLVLGIVANSAEVAVFAIGMLIGEYFISFSTAISGVFLPKITKMVVAKDSNEKLTNLLIKTGRLQFLVLGLVLGGFLLFGNKFIKLWAGPNFVNSFIIALLLMIPLSLVLTQTVGISILQAKNLHGFRAVVLLFISLLNLLLSILLANIYGAIGAAVGTMVSLLIGNLLVMNLYYHFKVKLDMIRFFKELSKGLFLAFVITVLAGTLLFYFDDTSWSVLIVQCCVYTLIYILVMWKFGMNTYEKSLLGGEFRKLANKLFKIKIGTKQN